MTGLYLFSAAVGVPLVLWFVLSGGDEGGEDAGSGDGVGAVMFRLLPLSTLAFVAATFGVCGLVLGMVGTGAGTTFVASAAAAAAVGVLSSAVFRYLRGSESTSGVSDDQLAGAIGRVVLPITGDGRGRVAVSIGGQQVYLSARSLPGAPSELEAGAPVLVVEVRGGVAGVTRLDPELG